jgi:hypothetical protein
VGRRYASSLSDCSWSESEALEGSRRFVGAADIRGLTTACSGRRFAPPLILSVPPPLTKRECKKKPE